MLVASLHAGRTCAMPPSVQLAMVLLQYYIQHTRGPASPCRLSLPASLHALENPILRASPACCRSLG